jgi:hypothetical protein
MRHNEAKGKGNVRIHLLDRHALGLGDDRQTVVAGREVLVT